jgi:predicted MFS family arabinose efflux permease
VTHYRELWSAALYGVFNGLTLSLSTIVAQRIGVSTTQMAVMLAVPFVGQLLNLYFGHLTAKSNPTPLVFWPGFVSRTLLVGMVFVRTPEPYFLLMSAYNLVSAFSGPAYASIMRSNYGERHRGKLMGNARIVIMLSSGLFSFLAGTALELLPGGYRWIFPLGALFGGASSLAFRPIRVRRSSDTRPAAHAAFLDTLRSLRKDKVYIAFQLLLLLCTGPNKLAIPLEPIWFVDHLHIDYHQAGLFLGTVYSVCCILGYLAWGRLTRNRDPHPLLMIVLTLYLFRYPVLALASKPGHLAFASVLAGFSDSGFELVMLFSVIRLSRGKSLAVAMGLHSAFLGVRGLVGPFIGNYLYTVVGLPIATIFWIITAATAVGILAFGAFVLRLRRRPLSV